MSDDSTEEYIKCHIARVRERLNVIIRILNKRAAMHDDSKLEEPELSLWKKMDIEKRYPYGSSEYLEKIQRNKKVFQLHYLKNRHHPEHYANGVRDMTLIDIIEMLCDWIGYKDHLSYSEATDMVHKQMVKYRMASKDDEEPNLLEQVMINTLFRYFSILTDFETEPDGVLEELDGPGPNDTKRKIYPPGHFIDFYA